MTFFYMHYKDEHRPTDGGTDGVTDSGTDGPWDGRWDGRTVGRGYGGVGRCHHHRWSSMPLYIPTTIGVDRV